VSDPLRAALDAVVLALLDEREDHGYGLARRIRAATGNDVSDGTLYPALARLESSGKIVGAWSIGKNGRRRKVFTLTDRGRGTLYTARLQWPTFARRLTALLGAGP
jgi:PadR family transcriptional regulator, regulatory protein PadR